MNILGIETSSSWGSVAVVKDDRIVFSSYLDIKVTHSERLLPQIDTALRSSSLALADLDAIAISNGPGSFTGIRIGLAAAKGLCFADEIPLYPVNTLRVLAANLYGSKLPILSFMDARMQEIYAALYTPDLQEIIAPCNAKPAEFLARIDQPVVIIGDGVIRFKDLIIESKIDYKTALPHQNIPTAMTLVSLILHDNPQLSFDFETISALEPWYLRKSQAELNKKTKRED
ncbi:MAG: tRNA (adenosine(37)-N6)-threonylcarbamoyltransferase complex dimerization subunit type 1 TsaB [Candidatus Cloacimonetes bacterium]|nr:tRNA (adenosine(37)-N6)-threonylcarbamoyltransferase complex dimerization subunit type 1 TsaB [Candidatus Cloacimonadota bacterium]